MDTAAAKVAILLIRAFRSEIKQWARKVDELDLQVRALMAALRAAVMDHGLLTVQDLEALEDRQADEMWLADADPKNIYNVFRRVKHRLGEFDLTWLESLSAQEVIDLLRRLDAEGR